MADDFICICLLTDGSRTRMIQMNTVSVLMSKLDCNRPIASDLT